MKQDGSIALFQYWNRLRGLRPVPRRTEIEPADIKTLLADTFILEMDARGEPVFRLAGSRLCAIYGRELKGFSFPSLWKATDSSLIRRLTTSVFETGSVVVVEFAGVSKSGRCASFETILLPLEGGVDCQRSLGSIVATERSFWLGADAIEENRVGSIRVVDPAREPMFLKNRPAVTVPPLSPAAEFADDDGRRVRHLVVFDGGRSN